MNASLIEIASLVDGVLIGDDTLRIQALSAIDDIESNSLIFAQGTDNLKLAELSAASAVLVGEGVTSEHKTVIQVANPFAAFITLLTHFHPTIESTPSIHATAVIANDVVLGKNISIAPFVVIESGCVIGDNCVIKSHAYIGHNVSIGAHSTIHPHVSIYDNCQLGEQVIIHASTVIGSDGFGYNLDDGQHKKIPHIGRVVIENNVEIGANTAIDRATLGATRIGEGTKIDNLVQIAHSVKLGKHNIVCGFTGIAGSTVSGSHVIFAANVGVSDHVRIDDGVILGARTGVPPKKHLKHGNIYLGNPARPKEKALEHELASTRIPLMRRTLKSLNEKVTQLIKRVDQLDKGSISHE